MRILVCTFVTLLVVAIVLWCGYGEVRDFVRSALSVAPSDVLRVEAANAEAERQHRAEYSREGLSAELEHARAAEPAYRATVNP